MIDASHQEFLGVRPEINEAMFSWVTRIALAYGVIPKSIFEYLGVHRSLMRETHITSKEINKIRKATGYSQAAFELNRIVAHHAKLMNLSSAFYLTSRHGWATKFRYCPHCLAEDSVPYFRIEWAMGFVRRCYLHGCDLKSRCPECHKDIWLPVNPFSPQARKIDFICMSQCSSCGKILHLQNNQNAVDKFINLLETENKKRMIQEGLACMSALVHGYARDVGSDTPLSLSDVRRYIIKISALSQYLI